MLSNYVKVMVKARPGGLSVYHRDSRSKTIIGDGFEYVWKWRNNIGDWYEALRFQNNSLPAVLDISSEFRTTTQIKRYK
jgi:hypothetical protein